MTRMRLDLEEFSFDVQYVKGKDNVIADALSRIDYEAIKGIRVNVMSVTTRAQSRKKAATNSQAESIKDVKGEDIYLYEYLNAAEVTRLPHLNTTLDDSDLHFILMKEKE